MRHYRLHRRTRGDTSSSGSCFSPHVLRVAVHRAEAEARPFRTWYPEGLCLRLAPCRLSVSAERIYRKSHRMSPNHLLRAGSRRRMSTLFAYRMCIGIISETQRCSQNPASSLAAGRVHCCNRGTRTTRTAISLVTSFLSREQISSSLTRTGSLSALSPTHLTISPMVRCISSTHQVTSLDI